MTKTISVRLDNEALRALSSLEATGTSRSEAIRAALIDAAARSEALRAEAAEIAADPSYRAEITEVQALMDELSEPW